MGEYLIITCYRITLRKPDRIVFEKEKRIHTFRDLTLLIKPKIVTHAPRGMLQLFNALDQKSVRPQVTVSNEKKHNLYTEDFHVSNYTLF